jgi:hypothetical protein
MGKEHIARQPDRAGGRQQQQQRQPDQPAAHCGGICAIANPAHDAVSSVTPAPIVLTRSELPSCCASGITRKISA